MESIIAWVVAHASVAHFLIFGGLLLAGCNIPISADLLVVVAAFLAATIAPDHLWHLYAAVVIGCYLSASIAYGIGRFAGKKLCRWSFFAKLLPKERLEKVGKFYEQHGFLTLLIGRFIPFGIRNCIFLSSGMSRVPFWTFALRDLVACPTWVSLLFFGVYTVGHHYQTVIAHLKWINIILFTAFGVTTIVYLWYKKQCKKRHVESIE
jgi:membrane protein DedA with SNARE-associated domain